MSGVTAPERDVRPYDFHHQEAVQRGRVRRLHPILDVMAHRMAGALTGLFRSPVRVEVANVDQQSWDQYVNELPEPTFLANALILPYGGRVVLHVPGSLAMALVDVRLGGTGGVPARHRTMTEIDQQLVADVAQDLLDELRPSFEPAVSLSSGSVSFVTSKLLLQGKPSEVCLVVSLRVELRSGEESFEADLCVPATVLLPILDALDRLEGDEQEGIESEGGSEVHERVLDTPLEVSVHFPDVSLSPEEILTLSVGDVVGLHRQPGSPLLLSVGNVTYCQVVATTNGRRLACMVIDKEEEH